VNISKIEKCRCEQQMAIDAKRSVADRRLMGQFATPNELAKSIVRETQIYVPSDKKRLRVLEPSMGTGSFVSAAFSVLGRRVSAIRGFELDEGFYKSAIGLWKDYPVEVVLGDFTRADPASEFDVVLANPPYVRHHAIGRDGKIRLQGRVSSFVHIDISGLAGLYCHFLLLSCSWMRTGAVGAWLIPSEWMSVNYGTALRLFLCERVKLLRIHIFDTSDVRFSDALVSSCVVWFSNQLPDGSDVEFTYGSDIENPIRRDLIPYAKLSPENKWPPRVRPKGSSSEWKIGDLFEIRRGIVTGDNNFFVMSESDAEMRNIPKRFLRPILPSPRNLKVDHVEADGDGLPTNVERRYLLDCSGHSVESLPEAVRLYLKGGEQTTAKKNLCASRTVWYEQEQRRPTPFLCSYMGRGSHGSAPVRFVLNDTRAIVSNSFLMMYPKPQLADFLSADVTRAVAVWEHLLGIPRGRIVEAGRSYGGGLQKVEPKELASISCNELCDWISSCGVVLSRGQRLVQSCF